MKPKRNKSKGRTQVIRVWTQEQAMRGLPYIRSIMRSLREHRLRYQDAQGLARRLASRPGRPDRDAILAQEAAVQEVRAAADLFDEDCEELTKLGIYCLDPIRGLALIPFANDDQLAWFVF